MKAIRVHALGGPEVLVLDEIPAPQPKAGEVLVKVEAAGVNFIDTYHRTGLYQVALPYLLGQEGAGTVAGVGAGVSGLSQGDRVAWASLPSSGYAEYVALPANRVVPVPRGVTTRQAAAVMLQGMTAHYLALSTFPLRKGHTCLIHAAAGGVGGLLVQIAKLRGAFVIATVGSERKAAIAREAGADEVILYREQDVAAEVKKITDGKLCAVVYDAVGKDTFEASLACVMPRGLLVSYGNASGAVPPVPPLTFAKGSKYLTRPVLHDYVVTREELTARARDLFGWMKAGTLHVHVHKEYPLQDAAEAHRDLEGRGTVGKLLLIP